MAVPVPLSVSVAVPQAAGRHQAAGAPAVAAPVCGGHRAASGRARLLTQHRGGAVGEETVEQQVVVLGGRGRCGGRGSHDHVVMLAGQRRTAIKASKRNDGGGVVKSTYLIVTLEEG